MKVFMLRIRTGNFNDRTNDHSKNVYETVNPPSYAPRKITTTHLHEVLTEVILESSLSEHNEVDATNDEPDSESTLIVNSTSANSASL